MEYSEIYILSTNEIKGGINLFKNRFINKRKEYDGTRWLYT